MDVPEVTKVVRDIFNAATGDPKEARGAFMQTQFDLLVDTRVCLTRNISIENGQRNGAMGTAYRLVYSACRQWTRNFYRSYLEGWNL